MGFHPKYLAFSATTTLPSHQQSLYKHWLSNFTGFQLQASSPSLVTAVVLQLEIAESPLSGGMQNGGLKESRMKASAAFRPRAPSLYLKMSVTQYRKVRATLIRGYYIA